MNDITQLHSALNLLFDQTPLEKQARFLVQIDPVDAELLKELYLYIESNTTRGSQLQDHPLELVALLSDRSRRFEINEALASIPHRIGTLSSVEPDAVRETLYNVLGDRVDEPLTLVELGSQVALPFAATENCDWIHICSEGDDHSIDQWLRDSAAQGWLPTEAGLFKAADDSVKLIHLSKRSYRIRRPGTADIAELMRIEALVWPEEILTPKQLIQERVEQRPEDQFVMEEEGKIVAVLYTQRIQDPQALLRSQADHLHELHDPLGDVSQFMAIFVEPAYQQRRYSDDLLEYALSLATVRKGSVQAVAVTRCTDYPGSEQMDHLEYARQRNESGLPVDPVVRMHVQHGASIEGVVPQYRPRDVHNEGYGVLVSYDLTQRGRGHTLKHKAQSSLDLISVEILGQLVDQEVQAVLTSVGSSAAYQRDSALGDLGLDSLSYVELASRLSTVLSVEFDPLFFVQHATPQAAIDHVIAKKIGDYQEWFYESVWKDTPITSDIAFKPDQLWIVFEDEEELASRLIDRLEQAQQQCIRVSVSARWTKHDNQHYSLDLSLPKHLEEFFDAIPNLGQLAGVVNVCGYKFGQEEATKQATDDYLRRSSEALTNLANALGMAETPDTARLWVIGSSIDIDGTRESVVQSAYTSLPKVVAAEYPEFKCTHIALDPEASTVENVGLLIEDLSAQQNGAYIAYRHGKRKVRRMQRIALHSMRVPRFQANATYLVLGGLRPLGLRVARWYVEHGAKHVILLDEEELNQESVSEIDALENQGAHISVRRVGLGNRISMKFLFNTLKLHHPPLKGIFHTAGVVAQDLLFYMDWSKSEDVRRLKIEATLLLHEFTKDLKLDHFVMFSSCLPDFAPRGKASLAMGNAFLEAFCHYRKSLGLPALTISWGPWQLQKMLRQRVADTALAPGLKSLDPKTALNVLDWALCSGRTQMIAADVDWQHSRAQTWNFNPLFKDFAEPAATTQPPAQADPGAPVYEPMAVIGIACRFPGGIDSPESFWDLIRDERDAITEVPATRWNIEDFYHPDRFAPGKMYCRHGGFVDGVDLFDAEFFSISPREAQYMDPQQRLALELSWEALEDAGIAPSSLRGSRTGVVLGVSFHDYDTLITQSKQAGAVDNYYSTGNHYSVAAGRIAYILGLQGPALAVDTACSSSLVSIDLASEKLRLGDCDVAIAGGVNLILAPESTINFCKSGMLAEDGHCKTFDEKANGYVRSEGGGMLILKRLSDAERDGDRILATIEATATNQDGASTGLTVPNEEAQRAVIQDALRKAKLRGMDVQLIEAHGTGTSLGDPLEMKALMATYGAERQEPLYIGSIKANIGHSEAAAGVAGLMRCILALQNQEITKQIHFDTLNPLIELSSDQVRIPEAMTPWKSESRRYAAVSSFGFSGTNAHAILGEAPTREASRPASGPYLFPLSAKNEAALREAGKRLSDYLQRHPEISLRDVAYTLQVGRDGMEHRAAVIADSHEELIEKLQHLVTHGPLTLHEDSIDCTVDSLKQVAEHWLKGASVNWTPYYQDIPAQRIRLPTYAFQRQRYWIPDHTPPAPKEVATPVAVTYPIESERTLWARLQDSATDEHQAIISDCIRATVLQVLTMQDVPEKFEERSLISMGMDSITGGVLRNQLEEQLEHYTSLPFTLIYDYQTPQSLSRFLASTVEGLMTGEKKPEEKHPISHRERPEGTQIPLSAAQKRMWFNYELDPSDTRMNIAVYLRLRGEISSDALNRALTQILERHPILRSTYDYHDEVIVQQIQAVTEIRIKEYDWRLHEASEQNLRMLSYEDGSTPFDLKNGPIIRPTLIWLKDKSEAFFHLETHHIACDGASFQIIFDELIHCYQQELRGEPADLEDIKYDYADYVEWLEAEHDQPSYQESLDYWKAKLADAPRLIQLPTDKERSQSDPYEAGLFRFDLSKVVRQRLEGLAQKEESTPFAVLLLVFAIVLHKYSHDSNLNIGIPFARRPISATEPIVGLFVNTLVTQHEFSRDHSFSALLQQTSQMLRDTFQHQAASFEEVVDALHIERDMAIHPLFQVHFNLLSDFMKTWDGPRLQAGIEGVSSGYPEFDLALEMFESETGYYCGFKYNAKIFERETVGRICQHFKSLLNQVLDDPVIQLAEISLLTAQERKLMLETWNQTQRSDFPLDKRMVDLFEEQVAIEPSRPAVSFGNETLSYQELNERANQLARHLREQAIEPDDLIGVCVPRSIDMVVAVLAVMKAGAAYVPLDPSFPAKRLAYMLEDSEAKALISSSELSELFVDYTGHNVLLDKQSDTWSSQSTQNLEVLSGPRNLAYAIYTSGSTGNPKGVLIENRSLTNFLLAVSITPGLSKDDVFLAVVTLSFDMSVVDLYLPLISGAHIIVASEEDQKNPDKLSEIIEKHSVTGMHATPVTYTILFESGWKGHPGLRCFTAGEPLKPSLAQALNESCKEVWNLYGPTEATVEVCGHRVETSAEPITIGRPLANTSIYILDEYGHPAPVGVAGRLFIGGLGLARGYHKLKERTDQSFVPNPFDPDPEARMYDTGDLARYLPDGQIVCMGRADYQVKVRGYRIELGDIEACLSQQAQVKNAAVTVREDMDGEGYADQRIVGYVIPEQANDGIFSDAARQQEFANTLKEALKKELPDYMVPDAIVPLLEFPLTPNKKIDRKALPKPTDAFHESTGILAEAKDDVEAQILDVWKAAIGSSHIGVDQNFFDAGGNSLLALRVINDIEKSYPGALRLVDLFTQPTVERLARVIRERLNMELQHTPNSEGIQEAEIVSDDKIYEMTPEELIQFLRAEE